MSAFHPTSVVPGRSPVGTKRVIRHWVAAHGQTDVLIQGPRTLVTQREVSHLVWDAAGSRRPPREGRHLNAAGIRESGFPTRGATCFTDTYQGIDHKSEFIAPFYI